ncbi:MAG: hypothetical protein IPJ82_09100 [Lewinellaceae bacterium]|nr:hypothetical protein [Lewinellaceae bacterium]
MNKTEAENLIALLNEVKFYITDDSDTAWAGYETPLELRNDIDSYIQKIRQDDVKILEILNVEFLPTSTFQEHSLSNGWGDEFLKIAERFDEIYQTLEKPKNKSNGKF